MTNSLISRESIQCNGYPLHPTINQIADAVAKAGGGRVSVDEITPFRQTTSKSDVADATLKFLATISGVKCFLLVSGQGNKSLVKRGVDNIAMAKKISGAAGEAILPPILTGDVDGRSLAVWKRQIPLPDGKISKLVTRWLYAGRALDWAQALCAATARPVADVEAKFEVPLTAIRDDHEFPPEMREAAAIGLRRLDSMRPIQCVQHGDLWIGNVMRTREGGLAVIDWAGARMDGYPVIDIARLLMSLGPGNRLKQKHFAKLCDTLSCGPDDLVTYGLAALGDLGRNLEFFPVDRYRAMSVSVFRYLNTP